MEGIKHSPANEFYIQDDTIYTADGVLLYKIENIKQACESKTLIKYLIFDANAQEDAIWLANYINNFIGTNIFRIIYSREYKNFDLQRRDYYGK